MLAVLRKSIVLQWTNCWSDESLEVYPSTEWSAIPVSLTTDLPVIVQVPDSVIVPNIYPRRESLLGEVMSDGSKG